MAKKDEQLKDLDLGVINEIIESNNAPDAKSKIQLYAKECGFKISKSNISVEDMVTKLLEMADEKENIKLNAVPTDKVPTPKVDEDLVSIKEEEKVLDTPIIDDKTEIMEMDGVNIPSSQDLHIIATSVYNESKDEDEQPVQSLPEPATNEPEEPKIECSKDTKSWLDNFEPKTSLIGATGKQYMNCPYWILDWILETGPSWKVKIQDHPRKSDHAMLSTVLYYIEINGSVTVRESRNSQYHTLY